MPTMVGPSKIDENKTLRDGTIIRISQTRKADETELIQFLTGISQRAAGLFHKTDVRTARSGLPPARCRRQHHGPDWDDETPKGLKPLRALSVLVGTPSKLG